MIICIYTAREGGLKFPPFLRHDLNALWLWCDLHTINPSRPQQNCFIAIFKLLVQPHTRYFQIQTSSPWTTVAQWASSSSVSTLTHQLIKTRHVWAMGSHARFLEFFVSLLGFFLTGCWGLCRNYCKLSGSQWKQVLQECWCNGGENLSMVIIDDIDAWLWHQPTTDTFQSLDCIFWTREPTQWIKDKQSYFILLGRTKWTSVDMLCFNDYTKKEL